MVLKFWNVEYVAISFPLCRKKRQCYVDVRGENVDVSPLNYFYLLFCKRITGVLSNLLDFAIGTEIAILDSFANYCEYKGFVLDNVADYCNNVSFCIWQWWRKISDLGF